MDAKQMLATVGSSSKKTKNQTMKSARKTLAAQGFMLTEAQVENLMATEKDICLELGRVSIGRTVLPELMEEFASSPNLSQDTLPQPLFDLQAAFYHLRDEAEADVPDIEIIQGMRTLFDGEAAGDVDAIEAFGIAAVVSAADTRSQGEEASPEETDAHFPYSITDEEGRIYTWNPTEWTDNVSCDGWNGERWEDD